MQFGFRKNHSTNHALIEITENIRKALDDKKVACGVFVDLKKAFDTVNHDILTEKLKFYGIRNTANEWFKSYLGDRQQFVSILGHESRTRPMPHGVPQGSVLGPLLFLIYINDLFKAINYSKVFHFADDTNLLNIAMNYKQMKKQVNIDLKILYKWMLANMITLNKDKTEFIIFHKPGHIPPQLKIKLNGEQLYTSKSIKYVGVLLDGTLSFEYHLKNLNLKLNRANGMLAKARHYMDTTNLRTLYYAIFNTHLTYGCQVWGQSDNAHLQHISKLQNKAVRIMNFTFQNSDLCYFQMKILKFLDQVKLQNCIFVHKTLNNETPECFKKYFLQLKNTHEYNTRSSSQGFLYRSTHNTKIYGINSISNQCIINWNQITTLHNTALLDMKYFQLKTLLTIYFLRSYEQVNY